MDQTESRLPLTTPVIVTRHRRRRGATRFSTCFASVGLAAALLTSPVAQAQTGSEPTVLTDQATTGAPPASPPTTLPVAPAVATEVLDAVDSEAVGILTLEQGGFGTDVWVGSSRSLILRLVDLLPARTPSRTARDMMHRLLLSTAVPPVEDDAGTAEDGTLLARRLAKLVEMGDVDGALGLVRAAPRREQVPDLVKVEVELLLLQYDNAGACSLVQGTIGRFTSPDWLQLQVFCQSLLGQPDRAMLGLELLREEGIDDSVLTIGIQVLTGVIAERPVIAESLPAPSPLRLALLRAVNQELPADVLTTQSPALLQTIAVSPNAPLALRLRAAERAETVGSLGTSTLAELYLSVPTTAADLDQALQTRGPGSGVEVRAVLYQAARAQSVATTRATVIDHFWQVARAESLYPTAVRLTVPLLAEIPPTSELSWFAAETARAYLAVGALAPARAWTAVLRNAALRDPDLEGEASQLEALLALMQPPLVFVADSELADRGFSLIAPARELNQRPTVEETAVQAFSGAEAADARTLALVEALGYQVPDAVWRALLDNTALRQRQPAPGPVLLRNMERAAEAGRVGETILLALVALGEQPLDEISPAILAAAVNALSKVGQTTLARDLVIEAMVIR